MTSTWRLDGRTAVVTGGTKGIGAGIVAELADLGAEVLLCARTADDVAAAVARHRAVGRRVHGVAADVGTEEGRTALVQAVRSRWSALHVLVNNAGANIRKPTTDWRTADFHTLMDTNATSAWGLTVGLHPELKEAGGASVVMITSVAGHRAVRTSTAGYAATKGALEGLVTFLAAEWGPAGIRVNAVAPWYVRTPLAEAVLKDEDKAARILARTPLGRVGEVEDIARAVAFLAMPASGWITGVCLPVDGGFEALGL